ncbi:MAG: 2OG-Fe(II) oxygenase, partial [Planctomycetota bacterium]
DVWQSFSDENEIKRGYHYETLLQFDLQAFLFLMNSPIMLLFLEELTGIPNLISDPYFGGGGPHRIEKGGFLKVHTDFNRHPKLRLYRRLNLLVYLNHDWPEEYGGHLELWDRDLSNCTSRILPTFNRTVVFETSDHSWHGHPHPLSCPSDRSRQSIGFYYYTAAKPEEGYEEDHPTVFRKTP